MKRRYWNDEEMTWVEERPEYYTDEIVAMLDAICVPYEDEDSDFWCVLPGVGRVHEDGPGGDRGYLLFTVSNDRYIHGLSLTEAQFHDEYHRLKPYPGFHVGTARPDSGMSGSS